MAACSLCGLVGAPGNPMLADSVITGKICRTVALQAGPQFSPVQLAWIETSSVSHQAKPSRDFKQRDSLTFKLWERVRKYKIEDGRQMMQLGKYPVSSLALLCKKLSNFIKYHDYFWFPHCTGYHQRCPSEVKLNNYDAPFDAALGLPRLDLDWLDLPPLIVSLSIL